MGVFAREFSMTPPSYCVPQTARVRGLNTLSKIVVYLAAIAAMLYFPWRLTTFNPHATVLSLMLYAAELFGLVCILLHGFMTWRVLERQSPMPLPDATVDVFIPTYNEPVDMLRRTVMAARNMKYPHETWLLDDGNRVEMAALAADLGVRYLSRTENRHAKAGNLNNALYHSSGEFIAIFDADHVPHEDYLLRTLGYFAEANVAFVQTPQDFYNLDSFQHRRDWADKVVWSEQSLFFRVIMPGKDYWNAAFFCGSCATTRRTAIEAVGGFATETVTEDLHTSIRLHKKGFGSVYHPESLAYGIAPDTFEPYESQRVRWGQGAMQVWRQERILSSRGLTLPQRLCYLASVLTYFDGWQKAFMFLLPSFVLVTGILPIASLDLNFVARFLPWYVLSLWVCEELGRGYARSWTIEQYNFLRSPGFAFATLTFFLNRKVRFRVTRKGGSKRLENLRRMAPHLTVIAIAVVSLAFGLIRYWVAPHMAFGALVLNVVWCLVALVISTGAVRFALGHTKQERGSYRFELPIVVRVRDSARRGHLLAVEDISSGGFSAIVPKELAVEPGASLEADLILPSGPVQVSLDVQRRWPVPDSHGQGGINLGGKFTWASHHDADALDAYLYGSNAEWRFSGLAEKGSTPVEWITNLFRRSPPFKLGTDWRPAIMLPGDFSRAMEVVVSCEGAPDSDCAVLAEIPLKVGGTVALMLPGQQKQIAYYKIETLRIHDRAGRKMFLHLLSETGIPPAGSDAETRRSDRAGVRRVESAA
jgi:cellulose synthase (UDP-forming)